MTLLPFNAPASSFGTKRTCKKQGRRLVVFYVPPLGGSSKAVKNYDDIAAKPEKMARAEILRLVPGREA
jgi:hypothetical protein